MTQSASFDAASYKTTTQAQWDQAAEAWHRWGPTLERWLGPATELMLDAAGVRPQATVLDVAAGTGGQTLAAARRVGEHGRVLATDISAGILEYAAEQARRAGLANVDTRRLDGEVLDVPAGSFDAAICRLGFMYFPDLQAALGGMVGALRPGGRLAGIVFSTPEVNGFFSIPVSVVRARAQRPPPRPGQPGPFSLGAAGVAETALSQAGLSDVTVTRVDAALQMTSAAECVRFERESFGALHQMLSGLDDAGREAAWDEIGERLTEFEGPDGFVGPCELLVVSGARPQ
jgi:SAM-dependent methyltransferase